MTVDSQTAPTRFSNSRAHGISTKCASTVRSRLSVRTTANRTRFAANKLSTDCPNRLYVFERIPSYRFEGMNDKELTAANRTECEDACLSATDMPCRAVTFDRTTNKCRLSRETRYMNPRGFKMDVNADYMENMCLKRKSTASKPEATSRGHWPLLIL